MTYRVAKKEERLRKQISEISKGDLHSFINSDLYTKSFVLVWGSRRLAPLMLKHRL